MACTVPQCSSRADVKVKETDSTNIISFHRFPVDLDLKKSWIKNIRKGDEWSPSQYTRICSLHFESSCFREGYGRRVLHSYAVPTIFPNQLSSCKPKLPRKRKLVKHSVDGTSTSTANNEDQKLPIKKELQVKHADDADGASKSTANNMNEDQTRRLQPEITEVFFLPVVDSSTQTDNDVDVDAKLKKMTAEANRYKILAAKRLGKLKNSQRQCSRLGEKKDDLENIIQTLLT